MWIDDDILRRCHEPVALRCWVPERPMVVLGSSNAPGVEADLSACARDEVPVLHRYGGGGAVVLHPGCAVVSLGAWVRQPYQNRLYFGHLNEAVIAVLAAGWPALAGLGQNGLSDITAGDKKVAGTSLFRSRNYLLYQASLLVDPSIELIEQYLRHPSKEPEYRGGRGHRSFLTGLSALVPGLSAGACAAELLARLPAALAAALGDELLPPQADQQANLMNRASQNPRGLAGGHA